VLPNRPSFWHGFAPMTGTRFMTIAEQVAEHLRGELVRGRWSGVLPGSRQLSQELEVNFKTVEAALRQLESEGVLAGQGAGHRRRIVVPEDKAARPLRMALLKYDPLSLAEPYMIELQHLLAAAGHTAFFAEKSLTELGMNVPRISRFLAGLDADAWVVTAGSRELLEWFAAQPMPAFALFGRREGLPIAAIGPDKPPAIAVATRHLLALGHRRIVLLARRERRLPEPGKSERVFLDELEAHGIASGPYHLPDWEETIAGFHGCLDTLFRVTPPTALIIDEAPFFVAALQFLAHRRILVPEEISLVCSDDDPAFAWCKPMVSHIRWDTRPVVRRIVRWAANVSRGQGDVRQTLTKAEFVPGGTIGPAKSR